MSLGVCLTDLLATKRISQAAHDRVRPYYDELLLQYEGRYGRAAAESMATEKALVLAEADFTTRKRQTLLTAQKQGEIAATLRLASEEGPKPLRVRAERMVVDMDNHRRAIRQQALGMNAALLGDMRKTMTGAVRDPVLLGQVLDEIFRKGSGNPAAKAMADSWRQTAEWLRSRFNAAGGHIGLLENWHLPQVHDMRLVRDAGFEAWRDFVMPLLDRKAMIDHATNLPFSDQKLELLLRDMHAGIASDGWTRRNPGQMFAGSTANQRAAHRVLHFADSASWDAYAAKFGGGSNAFDAMIAHIEGMSRDIAAMERLGPNPDATLRYMQDWITKDTATAPRTGREADRASDEASAAGGSLQRLYDEFTGANNRPERKRLALGFSVFRAQQASAKLGSAMLSVGGDYGLMMHNAGFNGISGTKALARYVSMLNPANTADRAQAARHVMMADQWADSHSGQWKVLGEELAQEHARLLASGVLRVSGLVAHTDIARQAFAMEMVSHLTHMRDRSFANLDPAFQKLLQRYDIGEGRWDLLRAVQPESHKGTDWLYPDTVAGAGDQALADDFMRMLVTEADYAVPMPDLRTRAMINSNMKKGTWLGELTRSVFLFKGFPLTILNMHGRRMLEQGMSGGQVAGHMAAMLAMRYGLTLLALTTMGGALSLQAKEVARGRDPMDMLTGKFWAAALLQGGGASIIGDFLFAGENRFGGGVAETAAGPGAQTVDTLLEVGKTPFRLLDDDDANDDHWKRAVSKIVMSEVPGISLWQTRQLLERTMGDLLNEWAYGDDVGERYDRLESQATERGTAYYAPPGLLFDPAASPLRAPDLGNALGGSEAETDDAALAAATLFGE